MAGVGASVEVRESIRPCRPKLISVGSVESSFVVSGVGLNVRFAKLSNRISAVNESHREAAQFDQAGGSGQGVDVD